MIKENKKLVKVVATIITGSGFSRGNLKTTMTRGIQQLKRGVTMIDFIAEFLKSRGVTTYTLHQRSEDTWATSPIMALNEEPKLVMTFNFVSFLSQEIGFHAKDLSDDELERDMKILKKVIYE